jgi:hypothetical protein
MTINRAQRVALHRKWMQNDNGMSYRKFRRTIVPGIAGNFFMVQWSGMWLGIEDDGYTHS